MLIDNFMAFPDEQSMQLFVQAVEAADRRQEESERRQYGSVLGQDIYDQAKALGASTYDLYVAVKSLGLTPQQTLDAYRQYVQRNVDEGPSVPFLVWLRGRYGNGNGPGGGGGTGGGTGTGGVGTGGGSFGTIPEDRNAMARVREMFPWVAELGLDNLILDWVRQGLSPEGIVAELRQTPQWKQRFPGIRRPNGELRMSEAQYLARETEYRQLLRQFGIADQLYDEPSEVAIFFDREIDPNELRDRLVAWDTVQRSGQEVKNAFYVYAGIRLSDEDLYRMIIDERAREQAIREYAINVQTNPPDHQTIVQRATQVTIPWLQQRGIDTTQLPPNALYNLTQLLMFGGNRMLSLTELQHAVESALIGGAALEQGLALPSYEDVQRFREAGINRARALEAYGRYSRLAGYLSAAGIRAGFGPITQRTFEQATFLSSGEAQAAIERALAVEEAMARSRAGEFGFRQDRTGRFRLTGFGAYPVF
jgi:hypothetical protein